MSRTRARHAARWNWKSLATPLVLTTIVAGAFVGLAALPAPSRPVALAPAPGVTPPSVFVGQGDADRTIAGELEERRAALAAPRRSAEQPPARASRSRQAPPATVPPAAIAPPAPPSAEPPAPAYVRPGDGRRTSPFGPRWGRLHAGVDLAAGTGSPVRAVTAGVVQSAGLESGYGKCVRLLHADGTQSVYAHMSALLVEAGQEVRAGDLIGREGNTGNSTGPHLHFEVRSDGAPVDPAAWLEARGVSV